MTVPRGGGVQSSRRPIGRYLLREDELREGFRLREEIGDLMIAQIPHRNRGDFIR